MTNSGGFAIPMIFSSGPGHGWRPDPDTSHPAAAALNPDPNPYRIRLEVRNLIPIDQHESISPKSWRPGNSP